MVPTVRRCKATPRGFEPLRAEPNGFRVHLLNRSDTVSMTPALLFFRAQKKQTAARAERPPGEHSLAMSELATFTV